MLRLLELKVTFVIAWVIRILVPREHWYAAAFAASRPVGPLLCYLRRKQWNGPLSQAIFLNYILTMLTRSQKPFSIAWKVEGGEALQRAAARGGVVLCSSHLPLIKVACRALIESGINVAGALAADPATGDSMSVWGLKERLPALRTGPTVLVRARSLLREGKAVLALVDGWPGGPIRTAMFQLAERMDIPVFLISAELETDGVIRVRLFQGETAGTAANVAALRQEVDRISAGSHGPSHPGRPG